MLKPLLLTLLLLGGSLQARLAHFCDVMEQAVETCCCGDHDEQPVEQAPAACPEGVADPCCRAVVSLVIDEAAAATISPAGKQGVSAHDPPPLAAPVVASLPRPAPGAAVRATRPQPDLSGHGARIYLRTLRLRL